MCYRFCNSDVISAFQEFNVSILRAEISTASPHCSQVLHQSQVYALQVVEVNKTHTQAEHRSANIASHADAAAQSPHLPLWVES